MQRQILEKHRLSNHKLATAKRKTQKVMGTKSEQNFLLGWHTATVKRNIFLLSMNIKIFSAYGMFFILLYKIALTFCCHIFYAHSMFVSHVTKHREDGEPWEETGDAVHSAGQESIPGKHKVKCHSLQTEVTKTLHTVKVDWKWNVD